MKLAHNLTSAEVKALCSKYGTRHQYTWKSKRQPAKQKDYHSHRKCPIPGCGVILKLLKPHLTGVHGIIKGSDRYRTLLNRAICYKKNVRSNVMVEKGTLRIDVPVIGKDGVKSKSSVEHVNDNNKEDAIGGACDDQDEAGSIDLFDDHDRESISEESDESRAHSPKVLSNEEKACKKILDDFYDYLTSADCGDKDPIASRQAQVQ